jgi:UDP-N-acetylmuramate--alanine ligase
MPSDEKQGTLGATVEQVLTGFNKSLDLDADLIICTGEAAFKYKHILTEKYDL